MRIPRPIAPRSSTRFALVHVDLSYGGCGQSLAMFTDDLPRMRWVVSTKMKDEAADALNHVIKDVADVNGICIGKITWDGGGKCKGRFQALAQSRFYGNPDRDKPTLYSIRKFYRRAWCWHHYWY